MLNITIYRGVPFQKSYNNVLYANNINEIITYLASYSVGSINNIAQFYDGANEIVLQDLYENCNYMYINDTNSIMPDKLYFIDNYEFVSGGGVKYYLSLDIWHTHLFNLSFKPSLLIKGHTDVFGSNYYNNKIVSLNAPEFATGNDNITNLLIQPYSNITNACVMALVKTSNGTEILYQDASKDEISMYVKLLEYNNYYSGSVHTTYEIMKVYVIPNFSFTSFIIAQYQHAGSFGGYADVNMNNPAGTTMKLASLYYNYYEQVEEGQSVLKSDYFDFELFYTISQTTIFDTTKLSQPRYNKKILVGAINNTQLIDTFTDNNPIMKLNFYLLQNKQIEIMFETMNIKINLTASFEVPFVNDNYLLYMNTNQNQINIANKQNSLNLITSLMGVGAGAMFLSGGNVAKGVASATLGAGASVASYLLKEEATNAKLNDMKNSIDRLDGINNNSLLMFKYGVGAFTIIYNDAQIDNEFNRFGGDTQIFIDTFKPSNIALYNFNFIQFQNVNIAGNFNQTIKETFENIFNKGVRIWYDTTKFLTNVNYKK